ncbi:MAG TPA: hypothetical protein VLV76_24980 [Candidatus Acidoferrum sp.]|nr:hypothetical protein [Candidatus Acidoferrum sp.]
MPSPLDLVASYANDPLEGKPVAEVAGFYRRLAGCIEGVVGEGKSLAARFLLHWLDGKGKPLIVEATAINDLQEVKTYLASEVRTVFLTQKKISSSNKWGGIGPRLKGVAPFDTKSPRDPAGNYPMMYEGPPVSTIGYDKFLAVMKKYSETRTISDQEKRYLDIFTSFHKFGIKTEVVVSARQVGATGALANQYKIEFLSWSSIAFDTYDWNYELAFPVPNPDFGSGDAGAVAPKSEVVFVHHSHAKDVKDAGLAADYDIKTTPWKPVDATIIGPATIDLARISGL